MKYAISRLVGISILSILGLFATGLMLRIGGLSSTFAPARGPFADLKNPVVAMGGDESFAPADSLPALQHVQQLNGTFVLGLDVQRTLDGEWILFRDPKLEHLTSASGVVELKNWTELSKLNLGEKYGPWSGKGLHILKLREVLDLFPTQILFLNVLTRYPDQMNSLVKMLDPKNIEQRFVIQSPFATAMREIRKIRPLWLYGVDPSTVVRFLFMNSIYLETITDLAADLFVSPLEVGEKNIFSDRVVVELSRRKKLILVEEPTSLASMPENLRKHIFGIVTRRPAEFQSLSLH